MQCWYELPKSPSIMPSMAMSMWGVGYSTLNIVLRFLILTFDNFYYLSGTVVIHIHHFKHHAYHMNTVGVGLFTRSLIFYEVTFH